MSTTAEYHYKVAFSVNSRAAADLCTLTVPTVVYITR